jgi:hypothetical protein
MLAIEGAGSVSKRVVAMAVLAVEKEIKLGVRAELDQALHRRRVGETPMQHAALATDSVDKVMSLLFSHSRCHTQ